MKYIKVISDLELGKVYKITNFTSTWILKVLIINHKKEKGLLEGPCISLDSHSFYKHDLDGGGWGSFDKDEKWELADDDEIRHLETCIRLGHYVDEPKQIELYNIY